MGWVILIIALVLGVILSNLLLLKKTAKMEVPKHIIKAIKEREAAEAEDKDETKHNKKPD